MEYADKQTDKELAKLEKSIRTHYRTAWKETNNKISDFMSGFDDKYNRKMEEFNSGNITRDQFDRWYHGQIQNHERWKTLRDQMANRMVHANETAASMINDTTPSIYTLNHNYSLYEMELGTGVSFSLVNENTVKELMQGKNHSEFRVNSINPARDYNWNTKRINNALTQGILQGDTPRELANRFLNVMGSNEKAAIRNARTSVTSAQNGGRLSAYEKAQDMGIEIQKEWSCTLDDRTREWHAEMDGERAEINEPFSNGLMYPGDPAGDPAEVYNCRCSMISYMPGIDDETTRQKTYYEWLAEKEENDLIDDEGNRIIKNISVSDKVYSIPTLSAETVNEILNAVDETCSEYNARFDGVKVAALGDKIPLQYMAIEKGQFYDAYLLINKNFDFSNDDKKLDKTIQTNYENGYLAGKTLKDYVNHEMAHVMIYQDLDKYSQVENREIPFVKGISRYADSTMDGSESLAEAFVRYKNNESIPKESEDLIKQYIERWKK